MPAAAAKTKGVAELVAVLYSVEVLGGTVNVEAKGSGKLLKAELVHGKVLEAAATEVLVVDASGCGELSGGGGHAVVTHRRQQQRTIGWKKRGGD